MPRSQKTSSQALHEQKVVPFHPLTFPYSSTYRPYFLIMGWSLFGYVSYKVANASLDNKIYDPFEILGIRMVSLVVFISR
jgi:translocation protein SEC63